ncbi:apolipoprotein D [Anastrepha obliqua]|uniref:apolipoprotein D n=1 Tax=Anastrepha obliqua TaxID=95512 RepID=UPI0024095987|nr:apolipoprotein D [Anastrepha obliqua]XP_054739853.1 apolipoprotein D [Anastrepha obliqua]XP_054739854.1 apolipoprotein D [Anastrepha obliqua]XP_054739855.1 apolipoprotein D [Anastrepha obliqua]XP_054739856.1 apolipoprotein D [Anastrepha obliqua]
MFTPILLNNKYSHSFCCVCATALLTLLLLVDGAESYGFGRCPKYPSMPKFNMSRVLGQWYEVERSFYLPEIASGCTLLEFQPLHKEKLSKFNNFELEVAIKTINRLTGNPSVNLGYATPENRKSSIMDFKFNTRFPDVIARLLPGSGKYQVLYTDYDNFAILWSCGSLASIGYSDQIWVFGRDRDFPVEVRTKIYDALKKLGLDPERLVLSKNKNCPQTL